MTRLYLGITVGPEKPEHIKTILSGPLPTSLDYCEEEITGTAGSILWRMRAVLKHHPDRVREITPEGESVSFFKMTNCTFPMLESVSLSFFSHIPNIPAKFLRGPDLSYLHHLRRLTVKCIAFMSIFDFLLSTTALTDLTLVIDTTLCPTPETSLLACLQVMPCLLSLDLTLLDRPIDSDTPSESSTPEDTVILEYPEEVFIHSKLKRFHLTGDLIVLKDFTRWLRAPSLEYLKYHGIGPGFSLLLDNDIGEHFDTA
jgi:hypothetical protein